MTTKNETSKNNFNATIGNTVLSAVHLAPYLPYELRFSDGTILHSIDIDNELMLLDTKTSGVSNHRIEWGEILPALYPLTELEYYSNGLKHLGYRTDKDAISDIISDIENGVAEFKIMNMCFQEHIDVFGLIKKGLAIDINTLSDE